MIVNKIRASVIVPIYNEEEHLFRCVESILMQDFPHDELEILLIDGMSTDATPRMLHELEQRYPAIIRVFVNPKRIQASAMNIGAANAKGEYLVRIDAHAEYPNNYISKCISLIEETGAQNAGCICDTVGRTKAGKVIAMLMTSPFGVGGTSFRTRSSSGYADTVPFGTFCKDYYLKIGGFDERLARSEDNEINYRIRKNGGKIYITADMSVKYFCRDTFGGLLKMAFNNGKWNIIAAKLCPGSMSLKYFVPLVFTLSLIIMPLLGILLSRFFLWAFLCEMALYFALCFVFAFKKTHKVMQLLNLIVLFPAFHISYGAGSLGGIAAVITKKFKN